MTDLLYWNYSDGTWTSTDYDYTIYKKENGKYRLDGCNSGHESFAKLSEAKEYANCEISQNSFNSVDY